MPAGSYIPASSSWACSMPSKPLFCGTADDPSKPLFCGTADDPSKPLFCGPADDPSKPLPAGLLMPSKPLFCGTADDPSKPLFCGPADDPSKPLFCGPADDLLACWRTKLPAGVLALCAQDYLLACWRSRLPAGVLALCAQDYLLALCAQLFHTGLMCPKLLATCGLASRSRGPRLPPIHPIVHDYLLAHVCPRLPAGVLALKITCRPLLWAC
eukprot:jgi/Chrzof1/8309/Cz03g05210.t1